MPRNRANGLRLLQIILSSKERNFFSCCFVKIIVKCIIITLTGEGEGEGEVFKGTFLVNSGKSCNNESIFKRSKFLKI